MTCGLINITALNALGLTVLASAAELGELFQILTMHAEKNAFLSHSEKNDYAVCWATV